MALDDDIDRLSAVPLLGVLDHDALRLLAFAAEKQVHDEGDILFRRGEPGEAAIVILSGTVLVEPDRDGAATIAGPNSLLAELALFIEAPHHVTATTREPCTILRIKRTVFLRVLREYPKTAHRIRRAWAKRVGDRLALIRDAIRPDA